MNRNRHVLLSVLIVMTAAMLIPTAYASDDETDFFTIMDGYVRNSIDCNDIEPVDLKASGTEPNEYSIVVDFREGNNNILFIHGEKCRVFYPIGDEELLSALFKFISWYDDISKLLPATSTLEIEVFLSDDKDRIVISEDTINKSYYWVQ